MNKNNCYTRTEILQMTGWKSSYLYWLTSKGKFPFLKLGKHLLFPKDQVRQYLNSKKTEVTAFQAMNQK